MDCQHDFDQDGECIFCGVSQEGIARAENAQEMFDDDVRAGIYE